MTRKKKRNKTTSWLMAGFLLGWLLVGCSSPQPVPTPTTLQPFIPPDSSPSTTPESEPAQEATQPPERSCTNQLLFVDDLSIPDGTRVSPGQTLQKRWLIENTGTCDWNSTYSLRLVTGNDLGAPEQQALYPARQGTRVTLQITFTAPSRAGNYATTWQAFDPSGQRFGDPFFMEITVE
jgi:hypothetical protein